MDNLQLLDAVERYLNNEMPEAEKMAFDQLRKANPEVDQLVVEHSAFLNQLNKYGENKEIQNLLHDVHNDLKAKGLIKDAPPKAVVAQLWKRYKRVMAVAASIAGVTTILIAGLATYYSRRASNAELQQLSKKFENTERKVNALRAQVESDKAVIDKAPTNTPIKSGGTGFLIDEAGYLVTNAHVVEGSSVVVLENNKGQEYRARIVHANAQNDIAILKIEDADYKAVHPPYTIKMNGAELGEQLFTLGYPREEIVYNEGYMSAKTGYNGDTLTCQIGVSANPGNSGGPVFNKNGEVIAIINTRQAQAEGVVFAINAKNIINSIQAISQDSANADIVHLPAGSSLRGVDRVQQIRKIQDCVFMVKSY